MNLYLFTYFLLLKDALAEKLGFLTSSKCTELSAKQLYFKTLEYTIA